MEYSEMNINAVFVEDPEGGYSAYIEGIPGVNTQGETLEEARENLKDALKMVLEVNKELSQKRLNPDIISIKEVINLSA
ncbi:MAG: type II toxin-antitoxin system HicB family antitoxin [Prolixibacteraceae bacterium]